MIAANGTIAIQRDRGDILPARQIASRSSVVGPSKPRLLSQLGPGLISGASDDDPTAIATYSQAGALFGFVLGWVVVLCYPIMAVVQEVSARIGRATGQGIIGNAKRHSPPWLLQTSVTLLVIANTIAISADLGIMADVLRTLVGGPHFLFVLLLGTVCVSMEILLEYTRYVAILKWTTLALFAYVAVVLAIKVPWADVAAGLLPSLSWDSRYLTTIVAIFGAAVSPYIFFWQSAQEAEDLHANPQGAEPPPEALRRIRIDTYVGMAVACVVGFAIIITTAATLHANGVTEVRTSSEAAEALRPIAGQFAFALFAIGIVGAGLLAVPVLAGSAAYAFGEARNWPVGLSRRPQEAKAFYCTLTIAVVAGMIVNFSKIDPIQALYWSAVVNGVVAVPMLGLMMLIAARRDVMGAFTIGPRLRIGGWIAAAIMGASVVAMVASAVG
jgi:Mn2+/Fe2+ NRAMP family transporter